MMNKWKSIGHGCENLAEHMADRLNGYRILILETREEAQFSRLLAEQGADSARCENLPADPSPAGRCARSDLSRR
jgi:hypothetical protein